MSASVSPDDLTEEEDGYIRGVYADATRMAPNFGKRLDSYQQFLNCFSLNELHDMADLLRRRQPINPAYVMSKLR